MCCISQSSGYTLGANYNHGGIGLGVAYEYFKNPSAAGAILNGNVNATTFNSLNSGYLGARPANSLQIIAAAGSYQIGPALIGAVYSNTKYQNIGAFGGATATFNDFELNASYRFTPALLLAGEYNYTKGNAVRGDIGDQKYNQFSLLLDYLLSKRTDVYIESMYQHAIGAKNSAFIAGSGGTASTSNQVMALTGIRTRF